MMFTDLSHLVGSGYDVRQIDDIIGIAAHHTVSFYMVDNPTVEDEINHVLFIDKFHSTPPRNWGGAGYTALVFMSGRGYICGPITQVRAGVAHMNYKVLSFAFVDRLMGRLPTPEAMETAKALISKWRWELSRNVPVKGHRDWALPSDPTTCPGDTWQEWVPELDKIQGVEMAKNAKAWYEWRRWIAGLLNEASGYANVAAGLAGHAWNKDEYAELKDVIKKADAKLQMARRLLKDLGLAEECGSEGKINTF